MSSPSSRGLVFGLIGFLAGTLLACGGMCLGLSAILSWAHRAQEQTTASQPPAKASSQGNHAVGFRKLSLTYRTAGQGARQRDCMLWYPATGEDRPFTYNGQKGFAAPDAPVAAGRHPLVLFSHGFLGFADQTAFLMEALARDGLVVAAVNHADATTPKRKQPVAWPNFADANSWDASRFRDRRDDLGALLDRLLELDAAEDSFLHRHIDRQALGAAGHSLGGYTVLGMIGGWPSWREPRLRAALLLSPYTLPFTQGTNLRAIRTPVMFQGATLDLGITPFLSDAYAALQGPKYFLVLAGETHFAWTNLLSLGKTTRECLAGGHGLRISDYSLAFFRRHLREQPQPLLGTKAEGLASYRFKGE